MRPIRFSNSLPRNYLQIRGKPAMGLIACYCKFWRQLTKRYCSRAGALQSKWIKGGDRRDHDNSPKDDPATIIVVTRVCSLQLAGCPSQTCVFHQCHLSWLSFGRVGSFAKMVPNNIRLCKLRKLFLWSAYSGNSRLGHVHLGSPCG